MLDGPPDDVTAKLVEAAMREAPLRMVATGAGGPERRGGAAAERRSHVNLAAISPVAQQRKPTKPQVL